VFNGTIFSNYKSKINFIMRLFSRSKKPEHGSLYAGTVAQDSQKAHELLTNSNKSKQSNYLVELLPRLLSHVDYHASISVHGKKIGNKRTAVYFGFVEPGTLLPRRPARKSDGPIIREPVIAIVNKKKLLHIERLDQRRIDLADIMTVGIRAYRSRNYTIPLYKRIDAILKLIK
jgi:hypothetical protein